MTHQQIQKAQQLGENYANDNAQHFFIESMSADDFAAAALENYNANADAFGEELLPAELEKDFLFGAKTSYPE
jgi:hypothetical protein